MAWLVAWLIVSLTGCLVTDQIELPPVPQSPPVVTLRDYDDSENLILFDRKSGLMELTVAIEIRDEDQIEPLKPRWRIVSKERPPGAPDKEYPCPEREIPGSGSLIRDYRLTIQASSLARGRCSRVDFIVSGSFKSCERDEQWDVTTQDDDASDIGRLSFWVWDITDGDPIVNANAAQALTSSCPTVDYRPLSGTARATSATTEEP